jgi:hypothetical protein
MHQNLPILISDFLICDLRFNSEIGNRKSEIQIERGSLSQNARPQLVGFERKKLVASLRPVGEMHVIQHDIET